MVAGALAGGAWALRDAARAGQAARVRDAFDRQDWPAVVRESEAMVDVVDSGDGLVLGALTARCKALVVLERVDECWALLDARLLDSDALAWVPDRRLTLSWVERAAAEGRLGEAASVAERVRSAFPSDPEAVATAFRILVTTEEAAGLLARAQTWTEALSPPEALRLRNSIAGRQLRLNDGHAALATLGSEPPQGEADDIDRWWRTRIEAACNASDAAMALSIAESWAMAADRPTAMAAYAVAMSEASLPHAQGNWITHLRTSADALDAVRGQGLKKSVLLRLVGHLALEGELEEARRYGRLARSIDPTWIDNLDEIERMATMAPVSAGSDAPSGTLRFVVDPPPPAGASLWISPERTSLTEGAWEPVALANSTAEVSRQLGPVPYRWVLRDELRTYASGAAWPSPGATVAVPVAPGPGVARVERAELRPQEGADGKRRLVVVILDCGDWRLTSYLRQRGEMPVLGTLLAEGWRAGLVQLPAFTAAAMSALTTPAVRTSASFPAVVHQLGIELGGLSSIGRNPFQPLAHLLPAPADVFTALGSGDVSVGNMLFSHGNVQAGRNAEVTGPGGRKSTLDVGVALRNPTAEELRHVPEWGGDGLRQSGVELSARTTAAQVDAVAGIVRRGEVDVLLYRLESLDLSTHGTYADTARPAQDDGQLPLYSLYRYIDLRLADIAGAIDGDDVLVVMSDHGIRTSMEHDPIAMFVAWGSGVPQGRTRGRATLGSVARLLARLQGVSVDWPGSDFVPWADAWREGSTPPGVGVPWPNPVFDVDTAG